MFYRAAEFRCGHQVGGTDRVFPVSAALPEGATPIGGGDWWVGARPAPDGMVEWAEVWAAFPGMGAFPGRRAYRTDLPDGHPDMWMYGAA